MGSASSEQPPQSIDHDIEASYEAYMQFDSVRDLVLRLRPFKRYLIGVSYHVNPRTKGVVKVEHGVSKHCKIPLHHSQCSLAS
jgi:hypothetical protein